MLVTRAKGNWDILGGNWGDIGCHGVSPPRDNRFHTCEFLVRREGLEIQMVIPRKEGRWGGNRGVWR